MQSFSVLFKVVIPFLPYYNPVILNNVDEIPDIKKEDIEMLSNLASKEANPVYPVPVLMDEKELQKFYYDLI